MMHCAYNVRYLSVALSVDNCLKQGNVLSTLRLDLDLEFDTYRQVTQKWSKCNGTYQRQVCTYDVNLLNETVRILTKNTGALLVCSKLFVLEADNEDTKYVFMPREKNSAEVHNVNTDD